jgi:hypothetical protein
VWAVAQYGSPSGAGHGHCELQPLVRWDQLQPPLPGTPTQSQPVWQSTPAGVVVVLQSHVVVDVEDVVTQSGGVLTSSAQLVNVHSPSASPHCCGYRHWQPAVVVVVLLVVLVVSQEHSVVVVVLVLLVVDVVEPPPDVVVVLVVDVLVLVVVGAQPLVSRTHSLSDTDQIHLQDPPHGEPAVVVVVLVDVVSGSNSALTTHLPSAFSSAVSSGPAGTSASGLALCQVIFTGLPSA